MKDQTHKKGEARAAPLLPFTPNPHICAGTGALKSGFTRTGKRTMGGILDDGYKSVARYYLNNFQDGKKQDAVDLVTGVSGGGGLRGGGG